MISINYTKRNIRRTPYQALAALMVMFFTFLAVSIFVLLAASSQKILQFYESKPQAIAFFKDNTTSADINAISNALGETGRVTSLKYVSKDEALKIYRERNKDNPTLLELVTANILPASLEISAATPQDLKPIADIIRQEPVVEDVVFPEDVVASLTQATKLIRHVGGGVVGLLTLFSILIILMIIGFKIRVKRDEIETMKLLGASTWFIRLPFILEGIFYAALGALIAWILSFASLWYFEPILKFNLGEVAYKIFPIPWVFALAVLGSELALAFIIGALGAYGAVRRYLQW